MNIIAATGNKNKIREFKQILEPHGFNILSLSEAGYEDIDVVEDGKSFVENSHKKAAKIMKVTAMPALADDSGLEVYALNGEPGIYSARYAGESCDDNANNMKLKKKLKDIGSLKREQRKARFCCALSLVFPNGEEISAEGYIEGCLLLEERGEGGFGYDPLFVPDGYEETFAEMQQEQKNKISHRAKALAILEEKLIYKNK